MNSKALILLFSLLISLSINLWIEGKSYEFISIIIFLFYFLSFIDSIGKTINFLQIPILFSLLQLLIMPIIVYRVYNADNEVIAFFYNMGITEEVYFGFMIPAIMMLIVGMEIPIIRKRLEIKNFYK